MNKQLSTEEIFKRLAQHYPHARIILHYSTPWELLVAVILSSQCTDVTVNKVTEKLFAKYTSLEDYIAADAKEFEQDIRSTGFYHNKTKNILGAARCIKERFSGRVPKTMTELLELPGVARKTANVVLGNAYKVVEGIAVDTHVVRLSQRLRLVDLSTIGGKKESTFRKGGKRIVDFKKDADPVKIERQLMEETPRDQWFPLTYQLIDHGRAVCKAPNPKCDTCVLCDLCPACRV